jgi:hypothetical protein
MLVLEGWECRPVVEKSLGDCAKLCGIILGWFLAFIFCLLILTYVLLQLAKCVAIIWWWMKDMASRINLKWKGYMERRRKRKEEAKRRSKSRGTWPPLRDVYQIANEDNGIDVFSREACWIKKTLLSRENPVETGASQLGKGPLW